MNLEKNCIHSFMQYHLLLGCTTSYGTPGVYSVSYIIHQLKIYLWDDKTHDKFKKKLVLSTFTLLESEN